MEFGFFYDFPIWVIGVIVFVVNFAALEIGYYAGFKQQDRWENAESGGGNIVWGWRYQRC